MKSIDRTLIVIAALVALMVPQSAFGQDVLKGNVHKSDSPTRIGRPALPVFRSTESVDDSPIQIEEFSKKSPMIGGISDEDFAPHLTRQSPKTAPQASAARKSPRLEAEEDDAEMLIAWEEWHHRVSEAIFQRWRVLGVFPGTAYTTLRFSRDGHVDVTVNSLELPQNIYDLMKPQYRAYGIDEIRHQFSAAVQNSVVPLNGSSVVRFPERSRRTVMILTPYFSGDVDEGYHYKHNDYERVHLDK